MNKQVSKVHYDFQTYVQRFRWISYWHQIDETLRVHPENVLLIGAGDQVVRKVLEEYIPSVQVLDIDKDLNPDFVCSVTECTQVVKHQFDCVLCCQVLEHLPFEQFELCIKNISDLTVKDCIISLPCKRWTFGGAVTFFNKTFSWRRVVRRWGVRWNFNGEHYWEIGTKGTSEADIRSVLTKYFRIKRRFYASGSTYHCFYILEKR